VIVAVVVAKLVPAVSSVTVSDTTQVQTLPYVCVGVAVPEVVAPSPKFHANPRAWPGGAVEADPLKDTATPTFPVYGPPGLATGAVIICTATLLEPVAPALSVTVNVAVKFPATVYVWVTLAPIALPPSPKFHTNDVNDLPLGALEPVPLKGSA